MKIKDIRNMTKEEMNNKIISLKKDLLDARFRLDLVKLKDTSCIRKIKINIARIKTILKEQEI
ncbi:50S ribosomal protein L29 [Candidatus Phytoplasma pini]|uniref:Large ribosomal subunit protein uL29 n=1 Tax=Candidatus Phytoplasma pini TaxID=267362 RepID=A0A559KJP7_9MOLU|nr:50S ribosomal protein L29 [Candidatus Phytoplasma pini]TVY12351.1 Ribosomal protein L29 [Candidatus Phytoplasma pini]